MKQTIKSMTKFLAVFLSFLFILEILPTQIMADAYSEYTSKKQFITDLISNPAELSEEAYADIAYEDTDKRDEYTKVYRKTDGTYTAVISELPLHFSDNGEWKDIDNTILKKDGVLTNSSNSFNVSFPQKMTGNNDIRLEKDGSEISFSVNDISTTEAKIENNIAQKSSGIDEADKEIANNESRIRYTDSSDDTEVEYTVLPDAVKEYIKVSDADDVKDAYSFDINIGDLTYILNSDGSVGFYDNNSLKFKIPKPLMWDSEYALSYAIDVSVTDNTDGSITLAYIPSSDWINSNDRSYPVIIDPAIIMGEGSTSWVEDTYVSSDTNDPDAADTNGYDYSAGIVGTYSGLTGEVYTKINTNAFPVLDENSVVMNATYAYGGGLMTPGKLYLKELTSPVNLHTVTYNTKPTSFGDTIDYYTSPLSQGDDPLASTAVHFDITETFNRWLRGETNNGFALIADSGMSALLALNGYYTILNNQYTTSTYMVVDYLSANAQSSDFSYHSQDIGRAGEGYVNDFTRSLSVSRYDISLDGNIMPVSIQSIYNGANADENSIYGSKWQNSFQRMIVQTSNTSCAYLTEDGDCIDYAFETENGSVTFRETHEDSGYSLSLLPIPSGYSGNYIDLIQVTRPDGYLERFDAQGYLISVTNPDYTDQHINLTYETVNSVKRIDYLTDGIGRKFDYVYSQNTGLLTEINCLSSNNSQITAGTTNSPLKVTYTYDNNNNLTAVTFADGQSINYCYDNNGRMVSAENIDRYKVCYDYDGNGRVETVTEKAYNGSAYVNGNFITYTETSPTQISLTDNNGMTETYFFNQHGQAVYTVDNSGNYYFNSNTRNDTFFVNSYDYKPLTENLLRSPSFETSSGWSGTGYSIIEDTDARTGSKVAKLSANNNSDKNITQTVNIAPGGSYTVSAYVRKASEIENSNGTFKINIRGYNASNVKKYDEDKTIDALTTDWQRFYATIDNSSNNYPLTKIIITVSSTSSNTEILIDDVQLQGTLSPSDFNLIENGSFSDSDNGWTVSGTSSVVADSIYGRGVKALKFTGGADSLSTALMQVNIDGEKNDVFTVGGWFKGKFVKSENQNALIDVLLAQADDISANFTEDRYAQIEISYQYEEEDENHVLQTLTDTVVIPYLQYLTDWQFAADSFALKGDTSTLNILIRYEKNANPGFFTGLELTYDKDAVVLDESEEQETSTCPCEDCEEPNCPCNCVDEEHCTCVQCQRRSGTSTKDTFGNITSTTAFDGVKSIVTSQAYSSDGNYLTSETDELGNTTSYTVNTLNGIISAITDPNGNTTNYSYNAYNLLTAVYTLNSQNVVESNVQYTYTNDRLTAITHNGFTYNITYDIWGQMTEFAVGTQPIITYFYGITGHRERLTHVIYHHATSSSVTSIDDNGVVIGNLVNAGDVVFEYTYNDDGKAETVYQCLVENNDVVPTEKYLFEYDSLGNVIRTTEVGVRIVEALDGKTTIRTPDGLSIVYVSYYDDNNLVEVIGGLTYTTTDYASEYTSSTGITTYKSDYSVSDGRAVGTVTSSDWFGRTTQEVVKTESVIDNNTSNEYAAITATYDYVSNGNSGTSEKVSHITSSVGVGSTSLVETNSYEFGYEYDANGNIIAEYDGNPSNNYDADPNNDIVPAKTYVYDNLNQLVRINDINEPATYTYEYDNSGNITSIKKYYYTTAEVIVSSPRSVTNYTYDSIWKDRLASAGSKSLTYDNIGNPVTVGSDTLTWEGRNLKSYTKGSKTYNFSYDENGLRHRKTMSQNGIVKETYDYVWSDGKLISQKYTDDTDTYAAKFIYSAAGNLQGFIYDSTTYLYVRDLQGDIVAIINEEGEEVLSIEYNAWGKITYIIGDEIDLDLFEVLKHLSPFTYRGYCYDDDLKLYYLQSRYYSPELCRFINTDDTQIAIDTIGEIIGSNLFAYCLNNPIVNTDDSGFGRYKCTAVGIQIEFSLSLLGLSGEAGIEFIYVFGSNKFYTYMYAGTGVGYGYDKKAFDYFKNNVRLMAVVPSVSLTNIKNLFSFNFNVSIGVFAVFTTSDFKWPGTYTIGYSTAKSLSVSRGKVFSSKHNLGKYKCYGVALQVLRSYGISETYVKNIRASTLFSILSTWLNAKKNEIKKKVG